ncbi:hypothetical protein CFK38_04635 [Brachybacterium vulturis]|uniref:Glycosyl transferase family 1 domain-containing protein n=1 Tax=Brachybacterium vulturis TaxID=2017484 RepID=A0A291GLF7_9MICO|nr:glycosyltransferase [Brachybacterium vulturis]ATG50892.1 hypothetical protein CFK38_04635 [Brachybacterium vulturis]
MKKLIVYPNASRGGVAAVIRGRAVAEPQTEFHCIFFNDRGGRDAYSDLPNVHVRVVQKVRSHNYISYSAREHNYVQVSVIASPETVEKTELPEMTPLVYEFHSSNMEIIAREIDALAFNKLDRIVAPTRFMAQKIASSLPARSKVQTDVQPNLVDSTSFYAGPARLHQLDPVRIPLIWIGRFDKGKGFTSFLRLLSLLPDSYVGVAVTSIENDPARAAEFLGEAGAAGVSARVSLLLNLPQFKLGEMYREAVSLGGALISTSLMESFGYAVAEALACELPIHAFELPVFAEHDDPAGRLHQVPIGDVIALADSVQGVARG